jgi:hypothetical protein
VNTTKFISASELSRELGCSPGKIINAVESGIITPAGKAGNSRNAAMIFLRDDIDNIKRTLETSGRFKAMASSTRQSHHCQSASDVMAKYEALQRATKEEAL